MRILAIAVIAATALILGFFWFQPECPNGVVVRNESDCVSKPGFDRFFCGSAFAHEDDVITSAGNVFQTQQDCQQRFQVCMPFSALHGWTPRPYGYCLVRGSGNAVSRMTPVYRYGN